MSRRSDVLARPIVRASLQRPAGGDRHDRRRPCDEYQFTPIGAAHDRRRDPRAADREPARRQLPASAGLGAGTRERACCLALGLLADPGRAALARLPRRRCCCSAACCRRCCWPSSRSAPPACCSTPDPVADLLLLFGVLLVLTLTEAARRRRSTRAADAGAARAWCLHHRRARRGAALQLGMLPRGRSAAGRRPAHRPGGHDVRRRARSAATSTISSCSTRRACSS